MIFQVKRTSSDGDKKPCNNCFPIQLPIVDVNTFKSVEEYDKVYAKVGKWLDKGTNHRFTKDGYIARDLGIEQKWGIRLDTLEDLLNFKKEVGTEIVLSTSITDNKTPCLEIYDDFRE